jgi:hypothetical protein
MSLIFWLIAIGELSVFKSGCGPAFWSNAVRFQGRRSVRRKCAEK